MFNSLIFLLLFSSSLFAKTWTVTNEGELQNALDSLLSGDEVLLEDGIYHGSFLIENKDLEETVIIRARNPHGAILTGATPLVATWEDLGDNIYKTKSPYNTWQLFRNFQQQTPARWPNAQYDSLGYLLMSDQYWAVIDSANDSQIFDSDLPSLNLDSAMVIMNSGSYKSYATHVSGLSGAQLDFEGGHTVDNHEFRYFLEADLGLLDTLREWHFDPVDSSLYVFGDPSKDSIWIRTKTHALTINSTPNVSVEDLYFFAGSFKAFDSRDLKVEGNRFSYPNTSKRVMKEKNSFSPLAFQTKNNSHYTGLKFLKNTIEFTDGHALLLKGIDLEVAHNYMHHLDYTATARVGLHVTIDVNGQDLHFHHNTVHTSGSSSFIVPDRKPDISYNDISNTGRVQNDGSVLQLTKNSVDSCQVHHNWIHDTPKSGMRFDAPFTKPEQAGQNGSVHHNVIWKTNSGLMIKGDHHKIYNNTIFDTPKQGIIALAEQSSIDTTWYSNSNSAFFNNLVTSLAGHRKKNYAAPGTVLNNAAGAFMGDSLIMDFIDFTASTYSLKENSILIDSGTVFEGYPTQYLGTAPDIGAYEFGEAWVAGVNWDYELLKSPEDVFMPDETTYNNPIIYNPVGQRYSLYTIHGKKIAEGSATQMKNLQKILQFKVKTFLRSMN